MHHAVIKGLILFHRYLANNEQLIQRLSESYPMRRAAQLTSFFYHKGKDIGKKFNNYDYHILHN